MLVGKVVLAVVWALCLASFFGTSPAADVGRILFWVLVVVHGVECVIFLPRLRAAPGSLGGHLVQTFFFGILHVRELGEPAR